MNKISEPILENFAEKILAYFLMWKLLFLCSFLANGFRSHADKNAGWLISSELSIDLSRHSGKRCHSFIHSFIYLFSRKAIRMP